jgi:ascorbate-specific PTS system EIIC-type component UlaA
MRPRKSDYLVKSLDPLPPAATVLVELRLMAVMVAAVIVMVVLRRRTGAAEIMLTASLHPYRRHMIGRREMASLSTF